MPVSAQINSISPTGLRKKKRLAPLVQEQAKAGTATSMVLAGKNKAQAEEAKGLQQEQMQLSQDQFTASQTQFDQNYALQQDQMAAEQSRFQEQQSQQRKKNQWDMILGGAGLAMDIMSFF